MKITRSSLGKVVEAVLQTGAKKATCFLAPDTVVKATFMHRPRGGCRTTTLVVTMGKPNYAEREFIKLCEKAGEPFPLRKVQLKWYPKPKRKR